MVDYYDDDWGGCEPNHPTGVVMDCSPDPVLSHDGETSQACRRCPCGRIGHHVVGCVAGKGPDPVAIARERVARATAALAEAQTRYQDAVMALAALEVRSASTR